MTRGKQRAHDADGPPEGRRLAEVVADNMRAYRLIEGLTQGQLGARMKTLGYGWSDQVVGFAERGERVIGVDEVSGLAIALSVTPADLMDPTGPVGKGREKLHVGDRYLLPPARAAMWVRDDVIVETEWEEEELTHAVWRGRDEEKAHALLRASIADARDQVRARKTRTEESER
jgi:transcriptional regulator with XRE-family HTH domain